MAIYKKEGSEVELVSEIQSLDALIATRDPVCDPKADLLDSGCSKVVLAALASSAPPVEEIVKPSTNTKLKETK